MRRNVQFVFLAGIHYCRFCHTREIMIDEKILNEEIKLLTA